MNSVAGLSHKDHMLKPDLINDDCTSGAEATSGWLRFITQEISAPLRGPGRRFWLAFVCEDQAHVLIRRWDVGPLC